MLECYSGVLLYVTGSLLAMTDTLSRGLCEDALDPVADTIKLYIGEILGELSTTMLANLDEARSLQLTNIECVAVINYCPQVWPKKNVATT